MPASDDATNTVAISVKGNLDFGRVVNINVRPKNPKRNKRAIDGRAETGIRG